MPEVKDKRIRAKWEKILFDCQIEPHFSQFEVSSLPEDEAAHDMPNERQKFVVKKKGNSMKIVSQNTLQDKNQERDDDYWYEDPNYD